MFLCWLDDGGAGFAGELPMTLPPRRARACYNQGIVRHPRVCRRPDSAPLAREHQRRSSPGKQGVFMVGILIVTHGNLGVTLAECAQHILQRELPHLAVMAVDKNDDPTASWPKPASWCGAGRRQRRVLLSDILAALASNIASRLIEPGHIEAVAGVSLPMLVRSLCYAGQPLETVVSKAVTGGLEGVMYIVPGMRMAQVQVEIINKLGLHARASSKFTQLAGRYASEIWISRNNRRVNAKASWA